MRGYHRVIMAVFLGCGIGASCISSAEPDAAPEPIPASADQPAAEPTPTETDESPPVNTLKWSTASEVDNFGFDIYRSLTEDGSYERITVEPIPGAGTTDEPQRYLWVDADIDPSKDYYYYIESISLGGIREIFSPKIRAPAKKPAEDGD